MVVWGSTKTFTSSCLGKGGGVGCSCGHTITAGAFFFFFSVNSGLGSRLLCGGGGGMVLCVRAVNTDAVYLSSVDRVVWDQQGTSVCVCVWGGGVDMSAQ